MTMKKKHIGVVVSAIGFISFYCASESIAALIVSMSLMVIGPMITIAGATAPLSENEIKDCRDAVAKALGKEC